MKNFMLTFLLNVRRSKAWAAVYRKNRNCAAIVYERLIWIDPPQQGKAVLAMRLADGDKQASAVGLQLKKK